MIWETVSCLTAYLQLQVSVAMWQCAAMNKLYHRAMADPAQDNDSQALLVCHTACSRRSTRTRANMYQVMHLSLSSWVALTVSVWL